MSWPLAALLLTEAESLELGVRAEFPLRLAAWRGQEEAALSLVEAMTHGAEARGEGCAIAGAEYDLAVLYNGLAQYERALDAAQKACASDDIVVSSWALYELAEAATRCGRTDIARDAVARLAERATASGTPWAMGCLARSRALVEDGDMAEDLYRQAIGWLAPSRMTWYLARTRLSYGEWLRRQGRRIDAREQLRSAHRLFTGMGAEGFAERARGELLATGEHRAQAPGRDPRRADDAGAADRAARPRRAVEPGDRLAALPQPAHSGVAPAQGVHQARDPLPPGAGERAAEPRG